MRTARPITYMTRSELIDHLLEHDQESGLHERDWHYDNDEIWPLVELQRAHRDDHSAWFSNQKKLEHHHG